MRTRGGVLLAVVVLGLVMGFALVRIGFGDYGELNRMFTFQDLRMLLTFAGGVVVAGALSAAFLHLPRQLRRVHPGTVPGAVLFGVGWALCGGCPSIPIVQIASGYLPALVSLLGIVLGMRLCGWATTRYLHVDRGSCTE
jgi:uncharacterized membrane protein YedE/YeeE